MKPTFFNKELNKKAFKHSLLAAAVSCASMATLAGEAVFYVTEDGEAVNNLSVMVDGQKKLVGKNGFVTFDLKGGNHKVELSQFGEFAGEFDFDAAAKQNAEVQIEMIAGEAVQEVSVYTPGQEKTVALGKVSGYLESEETGGGVEGALISVAGTELSVTTNSEGFYELEIPRGEYTLNVAHPSYGNREVKKLRVISNVATNVNLNMSMSGDSMIEEVVAVGSYIPSTATAQQRDSSAVLSAIGSEQMSRFGDSNAASALKRVAGVSLIGGQYAVIRGLQGRYISATLNDLGMPSTDPMRRDVPLDLFPASVLGGIEIQKSYTPDLPGDTTGGSIRMKTKNLPDDNTSKLSVSLGANSQVTGKDVISYNGGNTDFIGIDDGGREEPSGLNEFDHNYKTKQINALPNVSIAYSFGDSVELGAEELAYYGSLAYNSSWSNREDAYIRDTSGVFDYERSAYKVDLTGYLVAGVETSDGNEFLSKTILLRKTEDTTKFSSGVDSEDVTIEDTTLQWVERQFFSQQLSGLMYLDDSNTLDVRSGVSHTSRYEPDRRTYSYRNDSFAMSEYERRFSDLSEFSFDAGADHTFETMLNDDVLKIKTGILINQKIREVELTRYDLGGNIGTGDTSSDIETIFNSNNNYKLSVASANSDSYDAEESMLAVYQSYEYELGDNFVFLAGARLEDAMQEVTFSNKTGSDSELDSSKILPVASMTWKPTDEWQFRMGASNTVSRPALTELANSVIYDPETDDPIFGNPNLEISTITNLDFRAEFYLSDSESISLALFSKDIDKPIEKTVPDASGGAARGDTYENSDSAELLGLELDFKVDILDTDNVSGFMSGNFSWIDSEVNLDADSARLEGNDTRALQGQSELLANVQVGFDHLSTGQTVTLLANHFGDRISKVERGALDHEYEKGRTVIDLVYKWEFSEDLTVKSKVGNLTNEPVQYLQNDRVVKSYESGIDASVGVDYIF